MADLTVTYLDGGDMTVATGFPDLLAWEKHAARNDLPFTLGLTSVAFQAFTAGTRTGQIVGGEPFDAWVQRVERVEIAEEESPDPTRPGPGGGSPSKRRSRRASPSQT